MSDPFFDHPILTSVYAGSSPLPRRSDGPVRATTLTGKEDFGQ
jgi:hypothetical protein